MVTTSELMSFGENLKDVVLSTHMETRKPIGRRLVFDIEYKGVIVLKDATKDLATGYLLGIYDSQR